MKYSMSIAMVAILMAAAFVGVALVDDSDAAVNAIEIKDVEADYANELVVNGNVISGTLGGKKVTPAGEDAYYEYKVSFKLLDVNTSKNVFYMSKAETTPVKVTDDAYVITLSGKISEMTNELSEFKFIVTSLADCDVATFNELYAEIGQTIEFDVDYSENIIEVRYVVGDLTYVKTAMKNSAYSLVTLDALNAPTPERQKFVGWEYTSSLGAKNIYPAGSAVTFTGDSKLTAVFEALPEAVITFVDGTSTLKSINVSDLNEKTVPSVEKTGYTFDGWFMGDVKIDPMTYIFEESVTLVAQWTPINCYVTFVAGDYVKTVPVLYGDLVQAPALPNGFEKWNFDFTTVITDDLTITAVEKAPEKPSGFADPTVKMVCILVGLFVCVLIAVAILKRDDIREGMVRKLSKADDKEDKKE